MLPFLSQREDGFSKQTAAAVMVYFCPSVYFIKEKTLLDTIPLACLKVSVWPSELLQVAHFLTSVGLPLGG